MAYPLLLRLILEAIDSYGNGGTPGGPLYAALMTLGCSLEDFERIMGILVGCGAVKKSGHCYHITAKGRSVLKEELYVVPKGEPS